MGRTAIVFPGQGSQAVGMGREWWESSVQARDLFAEADDVMRFPLRELCFAGPAETLTRTEYAQPALYVVGFVAWTLLSERGWTASAMAGHSLGEFTALAAAGAWSFADGLRAVKRRGELMGRVGEQAPGGMAAILGLDDAAVEEVCARAASAGVVQPANYNSPGQVVISGTDAGLAAAMELAKAAGARRCLRLNVSAPFHSPLMAPIAREMAEVLAATPIRRPALPTLANLSAVPVAEPEEIRTALVSQLIGCVRWSDTVRRFAAMGIAQTVEAGPGKVLTGLTPRIVPGMAAFDSQAALEAGPPG